MTKGTIIYWGGFELPDKNAAAHRVVANGKIFTSLGYQVVYLGTTSVDSDTYFDGIRGTENQNIYEEAHPLSTSQWVRWFFSIANLEVLVPKYDDVKMIIVYNVPYVILKKVKAKYKKLGIKVVYDCTEWSGETKGSFPKRILKKLDEYFVRTRTGKVSDGVIVISKMMEKAYEKQAHTLRLPPLVDVEDAIWHQSREKETEAFEFCFAGVPGGNKESLDKIIEAFANLSKKMADKIQLRIVGPTKEQVCEQYPHLAELLDSGKARILFTGRVSHEESIKFVLGCDCYIFVRPSNRRNNAGFPTKFAESFTCGGRIITTDVSDIAQYLRKADRGQVLDKVDVHEIQAAMKQEIANAISYTTKELDQTFHYASYEDMGAKWIADVLDQEGGTV